MIEVSEWVGFGGRLTEALREVSDRVFLVVFQEADPHVFVQFAGGEHELHAEAAGVSPEHVGTMAAAGWVAPVGNSSPNWSSSLPQPALTAEYSALAARCVVALRDVHGLPGPDGLVYKAWRDPEPTGGDPADRDPGENPLDVSWLGLPPARRRRAT